ncbi:MAG: hypothetical protein WC455_20035 [Dehalococcoidia bacterium]|jgi:hypothetical protein
MRITSDQHSRANEFFNLVNLLKQFRMNCTPARESDIESALVLFLKFHNYPVKRQLVIRGGRLDLMAGQYIIEVKMIAQKNIADQLDRYSGHCDGLIVVCWKATDPLRSLFAAEQKTALIPVELIEVRNACGMI